MKRTFLFPVLLVVAVFALASQSARADGIVNVAGTTTSNPPSGITFNNGSLNVTTANGFAGITDMGSYFLSAIPAIYSATVDLQVVFSIPTGINGGPSTNFVANLFGNVTTGPNGNVNILFTNPSQTFSFSNAGGSGSFTFNVNSLLLTPGLTTTVTGSISNASFTPVPEPSSTLLLGAGLLLTPFLGLKRLC